MTSPISAKNLNKTCACRTLDSQLLNQYLEGISDDLSLRPHLFSTTAVFISLNQFNEMKQIIQAAEEVIGNDKYQKQVLRHPVSLPDHGPSGVFMGYDFHLTEKGPKLIEINTNAGGALLNLSLARAQLSCCSDMNMDLHLATKLEDKELNFIDMFKKEWSLQRGEKPLTNIAIVDANPEEQYLYPEFKLFQKLFTHYGIKCFIADPRELLWREGQLFYQGEAIDMIYNRYTDFYLEDENSASLKEAYLQGGVVITPNPHHHALYANKLNLITLSSEEELSSLGIAQKTRKILLNGIPTTKRVSSRDGERWWLDRKKYFFKPVSGYGGKAIYRGDKITRKVWTEILQNDYVAQELTPPSLRLIRHNDKDENLKLDLRAYVYEGEIQLMATRLYSGQTTNFRTPGGGFSPVFLAEE